MLVSAALFLSTSYALFSTDQISIIIIKTVVWFIVLLFSATFAWIGYTLLTTNEPKSSEELRKEIEEELERIKKEAIDAAMSKNEEH